MGYKVKLSSFEGPLDLLLHLIEKQELDIHDIPIAQITEQYLQYLWAMKQLDLDVASEFLVMGATLLSIKAKILLPKPPIEVEAEALADPREELVVRLLEYQKYKNVVQELRARELEQGRIYDHLFDFSSLVADISPPNPLQQITPWDLLEMYQLALAKADLSPPVHRIVEEEFTVSTQMERILHFLSCRPEGLEFADLLPELPPVALIVVNFLALLELLRLQLVELYQAEAFGTIHIVPCKQATVDWEGERDAIC